MKASQTKLLPNRFVCVCVVLKMLGLSGDECAVIHLCPVADRWASMWVRANVSPAATPLWQMYFVCFYTTYVGKKWARLKISQFCQNFERSIHSCFHRAACLQGMTAHTQVLLWCGANNGKSACCAHVVHREPVHLALSLICCGAACLQEEVQRSV